MENQEEFKANPKHTTTVQVDFKLYRMAKENFVKLTRALEIGIYAELIDQKIIDLADLPQNYNYFTREIARLKKEKIALMEELNEVKENGEENKCISE